MKVETKLLDFIFANIDIEDIIKHYSNLGFGNSPYGLMRLENAIKENYEGRLYYDENANQKDRE